LAAHFFFLQIEPPDRLLTGLPVHRIWTPSGAPVERNPLPPTHPTLQTERWPLVNVPQRLRHQIRLGAGVAGCDGAPLTQNATLMPSSASDGSISITAPSFAFSGQKEPSIHPPAGVRRFCLRRPAARYDQCARPSFKRMKTIRNESITLRSLWTTPLVWQWLTLSRICWMQCEASASL
jgi:hypothetical protein